MYKCIFVSTFVRRVELFFLSSCLPLLFSFSAFFLLYLSQKYDTLAMAPIDSGENVLSGVSWQAGKGLRMCMTFFRTFLVHNVINERLKHSQQQRAAEKEWKRGHKLGHPRRFTAVGTPRAPNFTAVLLSISP